jgi:hypothetical protein
VQARRQEDRKFPLCKAKFRVIASAVADLPTPFFYRLGAFAGPPERANLNLSGRQFSGTWPWRPGAFQH